ncbi:hypothetical protein [Aminivibrio sp.]|jgi:hypothetical protein|uniref:hypothetical protein n=1 Tax=Aminivibrio sp. TaxID=1872489 RepID=UPI001A3B568E|nr:hypothetical protein [Aminivibrio sp.]MBL3540140.1 hypothetical protein [Aminivibrio sp.]
MLRSIKIREVPVSGVIGKVRGFSSISSFAPENGELTGERKSPSRLDNARKASFTAEMILAPYYGRPVLAR